MTLAASLFGLVLAGGASTRMGKDKAVLAYHGKSQLQWAYELLHSVCARSFISVRPDQCAEPTRANFSQIVDIQPGIGPIAGINAAFNAYPDNAWLILACDLPFLSREVLLNLIQHRNTNCIATAYRSSHDNLPEPLCAIWEPTSSVIVSSAIANGKFCPRKILINSNTALLEQPHKTALDNINTPEELASARALIS